MSKPKFLKSSLEQLIEITKKTHNEQIQPVAIAIWQKHLQAENPLWEHVVARPFSIKSRSGSAHVIAIVDKRLPDIGIVGFFACTNKSSGVKVLQSASEWLKNDHGFSEVYGPINGTITRDYRLNLSDDFKIPGEPVNPTWYIDAFREAGFEVYNRYVSGISKHYRLFIKFHIGRKPAQEYSKISLRRFDVKNQLKDLRSYHELMNAIFPQNSIYCPVLSWEERVYNVADKSPIFDPKYTYFLEDKGHPIGFIVAHASNSQLVIKTIGLLPEYRGKGLSWLLIKKVHDQASNDRLEAAVYSTIRVGNAVYKMKRPGVKVFRKYVTMRKSL
jgi:GNAT superfamily N-acetyltransferase